MTLTLKIFFPFYSFTPTKVSLIVFLGNTAIVASAATMNFGLFLIIICSCHTYKNLHPIITKLSLLLTRICYKFCLDTFNAGGSLKSLVFIYILLFFSFHLQARILLILFKIWIQLEKMESVSSKPRLREISLYLRVRRTVKLMVKIQSVLSFLSYWIVLSAGFECLS
jgi:hypothetical protein